MEDQRKVKRRYLLYYARVYDASTRQWIGNLVDITPGGAMILGDAPIPEGRQMRLRIELTEDVADKPYLDLNARARWHRPDLDPTKFDIGFEIENISKEDAAIIQRIVDLYGFRDNQRT